MKRFLIFSGLLLLITPPAYLVNAQPATVTLPVVTANNLLKDKVTLPADLSTPASLLVLSFLHDQQADSDGWLKAAGSLAGVRTWTLPVFSHKNQVYRWWMNSSLRSSSHDSRTWANTVPLYVNKTEFRGKLQIADEREVVVLLVNRAGAVLWRSSGPVTPEKRESLSAAATSIKP